jgi:CBS domain-containing protein
MSDALNTVFTFNIEGKNIGADAKLPEAVAKMGASGKHCLLVMREGGKPVGIISEHDIVIAFARLGQEAKHARVRDYMTIDVIAARETDTVTDALKLMAVHNVRHLPVLSEKGQVIDFLSMIDLVVKKMTS